MNDSISVWNKNSCYSMMVGIFVCSLLVVGCALQSCDEAMGHTPPVEIEILCHSEYPMDMVYETPLWEKQCDNGYKYIGGKYPVNFFIVIKNNNPNRPLCIYRPEYAFGYYDLHFECLSNGIITKIVRHDGVRWTKNIPEKSVIRPRSRLAIPVCLDKTLWKNAPEMSLPANGEFSDNQFMIRAIMTNGVWKVGSNYEWATPHVITSQWAMVSLLSSERDVGWSRK